MYLFGICDFTTYGAQSFVGENGWSWHVLVFFLYFNISLTLHQYKFLRHWFNIKMVRLWGKINIKIIFKEVHPAQKLKL